MVFVRAVVLGSLLISGVLGSGCPDDPETDLCDTDESETNDAMSTSFSLIPLLLSLGAMGRKGALFIVPFLPFGVDAALVDTTRGSCKALKELYKNESCCGNPTHHPPYSVVPIANRLLFPNSANPCIGAKPLHSGPGMSDNYFENKACFTNGVRDALEQAGANVTVGFQGEINATGRVPILTSYREAGLCPVNVHWHLGTEHLSVGEYDDMGTGPDTSSTIEDDPDGELDSRRLAAARLGGRCSKYDSTDTKFTTEYHWQHCEGMHVGETYEVHWPHSAAGMCGTPYQYNTPFYDGVFCMPNIISLSPLNTFEKIGVQAQVFTVVNDDAYYYPDLIRGWIDLSASGFAADVAYYTGSTTGTSRDNSVCSWFTPITWQVDRKCHLISASSFDKMCADMKMQSADMSSDLHPHGSRMLVWANLTADNMQRL